MSLKPVPPPFPSARDHAAPSAGQDPLAVRRRRLLYRAHHRGTHETDILVGGFVARHIAAMDAGMLDALEEVMEFPDTDLADWLSSRRPIPPECDSPLLRQMRDEAGRGAGRAG